MGVGLFAFLLSLFAVVPWDQQGSGPQAPVMQAGAVAAAMADIELEAVSQCGQPGACPAGPVTVTLASVEYAALSPAIYQQGIELVTDGQGDVLAWWKGGAVYGDLSNAALVSGFTEQPAEGELDNFPNVMMAGAWTGSGVTDAVGQNALTLPPSLAAIAEEYAPPSGAPSILFAPP